MAKTHHPTILPALAVIFAGGCFNPQFQAQIACGPAGECPPGESCGADFKCHRPGDTGADAAPDVPAVDATPDARLDGRPDAMPVGCQNDDACQTPPDACLLPGTCNLATHECTFPSVNCAGAGDECNEGVCDPTRGCIKVPIRQGGACGQDQTCGAFGACGGFSDTCDETGTQSRPCTTFTCQDGLCNGTPFIDTQACTRDTDTMTCGQGTTCGAFGACGGFSDTCDNSGTQSRTCTDFTCGAGACTGTPRTETQNCMRNTDTLPCGQGTTCGAFGACGGFSDTCDESGTQSRTCTDFTCGAGACSGTPRTETQNCMRNTDHTPCPPFAACGPFGACDYSDVCDEDASQTRTCMDFTCQAGTCTSANRTEGQACNRETEGVECVPSIPCAPPLGGTRPICCDANQACTVQSHECGDCAN